MSQNGDVNFDGVDYEGPCSINQKMALKIQATNILGNIVKTVVENESVSKIVNDVKQQQEIEAKGLADVVDKLGKAIANIVAASSLPILAIGIAVVIVVMGGGGNVLISLMGDGKSDGKGGAEGGAKKGGWKTTARWITVLLCLVCVIVLVVLYFLGVPPFTKKQEYPPEVVKNKCEKEFKKAKAFMLKYEEETDEEKKKQLMIKNKKVLTKYDECIGKDKGSEDEDEEKEESFTRKIYRENYTNNNYVYNMRGLSF